MTEKNLDGAFQFIYEAKAEIAMVIVDLFLCDIVSEGTASLEYLKTGQKYNFELSAFVFLKCCPVPHDYLDDSHSKLIIL